jgi:hypothetical protein
MQFRFQGHAGYGRSDERTCCGPQPSSAPKIKTLEKIKSIDFNFENQD